jgi:hypothetical protein
MIKLYSQYTDSYTEVTVGYLSKVLKEFFHTINGYYSKNYPTSIMRSISDDSNQDELIESFIKMRKAKPSSDEFAALRQALHDLAPDLTKAKLKLAGYSVDPISYDLDLPF